METKGNTVGGKDRTCHKSSSFEEAEAWDVEQQISMTPHERQEAALELKRRVYGEKSPDIKESHTSETKRPAAATKTKTI